MTEKQLLVKVILQEEDYMKIGNTGSEQLIKLQVIKPEKFVMQKFNVTVKTEELYVNAKTMVYNGKTYS